MTRYAIHFIACTLAVGVLGVSSAHATSHPEPVEIRINGDFVNFRNQIPNSLPQRWAVNRHFQRIETLFAYYQKHGPSPTGEIVPWFFVKNHASREEGWVISTYVEPINPADAEKLHNLPCLDEVGSKSPHETADWLDRFEHKYHPGWLASVLGGCAFLGAIYRWLKVRIYRSRQHATAANVIAFPSPPPPEPDVLFGMAGGQVWVHRRTRNS